MEQKLRPRIIRESIYPEALSSPEDTKAVAQELIKIFGEKLDVLEKFLEYIFEAKWPQTKE
jgi:hypothetical protein